jgi:Tfp pilus assembly protein PilF
MTIIFPRNTFLYLLFPELKGINLQDKKEVQRVLQKVSSYEGYTPEVLISENTVSIVVDQREAQKTTDRHRQIVQLAEKGDFEKAKQLLIPLIEAGSQNAELYRIYGQILEQEGNPAAAMNQLIEALRWDPQNTNALIMMGNIFANYKNDVDTARIYYDQVVSIEPENFLALNNIGSVLAKSGKLEPALHYFEKARLAQPNYPNTLYGLALTYYHLKDNHQAFEYASLALKASQKWNERNDTLTNSAKGLMMEAAQLVEAELKAPELFSGLRKDLQEKTGKEIEAVADNSIPTAAKIEIAEYRGHDHHIIRYKDQAPGVAHLVMHELTHLELIHEARALDENKLFTSDEKNKRAFWNKANREKKKMLKGGIDDQQIDAFLTQLFEGINLQTYNAPIDLFIEQRLYDRHKKLRPIQFLSLFNLLREAIAGANNATAKKISPKFVRDANIILSFTQIFQFRELYGLDLTGQIKEPTLQKKAKHIYQEYLRMKDDKEPGEEYDLIEWWAEDLKLSPYFTLIQEASDTKPSSNDSSFKLPEELMEELENDPFELDVDRAFQDAEMKKFVANQRKKGMNMAVVMHMVDALEHFSGMPKDKIREIGFEVAHLGRFGINPEQKETYRLSTVPGKDFSGWKLLAYMYVSWSIFEPKMVKELQLDFAEEYKLAQDLNHKK